MEQVNKINILLATVIALMGDPKVRALLRKEMKINFQEGVIMTSRDVEDSAIIMGIRAARQILSGHLPRPINYNGFTVVRIRDGKGRIIGRITPDGAWEEILSPVLMTPIIDLVAESVLNMADLSLTDGKERQRSFSHVLNMAQVCTWAEEVLKKEA